MKTRIAILFFMLIWSTIYSKEIKLEKIEIAKYYYAYYELRNSFTVLTNNPEFAHKIHPLPVESISYNYFAVKYNVDFLDLEVFLVYNNSTDRRPVKLGIDHDLNIFKLGGFYFYSYHAKLISNDNDTLIVKDLLIYKESSEKINKFIIQMIGLLKYDDHPDAIKLLKNDFTIKDKNIFGNCKTEEMQHINYKGIKVIKDWKYCIPNNGKIQIELIPSDHTGIN